MTSHAPEEDSAVAAAEPEVEDDGEGNVVPESKKILLPQAKHTPVAKQMIDYAQEWRDRVMERGFREEMEASQEEWQAAYRSMQFSKALAKLPGFPRELREALKPAIARMEEIHQGKACRAMPLRPYTKQEIATSLGRVGEVCGIDLEIMPRE